MFRAWDLGMTGCTVPHQDGCLSTSFKTDKGCEADLFALVAGDLVPLEDSFTTVSGKTVALRIYTEVLTETYMQDRFFGIPANLSVEISLSEALAFQTRPKMRTRPHGPWFHSRRYNVAQNCRKEYIMNSG